MSDDDDLVDPSAVPWRALTKEGLSQVSEFELAQLGVYMLRRRKKTGEKDQVRDGYVYLLVEPAQNLGEAIRSEIQRREITCAEEFAVAAVGPDPVSAEIPLSESQAAELRLWRTLKPNLKLAKA